MLLTATDAAGTEAVYELTNPDLDLKSGERLPAESLRIRIERCAESDGVLRQTISVRSYHCAPIRLSPELRLGADFLPMLELRGIVQGTSASCPPRARRASPSSAATASDVSPSCAPRPSRGRTGTARSSST